MDIAPRNEQDVLSSPEAQWRSLRTLVHGIALSVLILTGTVFVFIYREVVVARRQTAELVRFIVDYDRTNAREFIAQVQEKFDQFRREHPDFAPIYTKYFGTNEPPPRLRNLSETGATNPPASAE